MKIIGKAAIKAGNKYLVLLRLAEEETMSPTWDFPGGDLEPGEDINIGLSRKVEEETGLKVAVTKKQANYEIVVQGLPYYFVVYEAKIVSGTDIVLSPEHSEYLWADKQELKNLKLNTFLKEFIKEP